MIKKYVQKKLCLHRDLSPGLPDNLDRSAKGPTYLCFFFNVCPGPHEKNKMSPQKSKKERNKGRKKDSKKEIKK